MRRAASALRMRALAVAVLRESIAPFSRGHVERESAVAALHCSGSMLGSPISSMSLGKLRDPDTGLEKNCGGWKGVRV